MSGLDWDKANKREAARRNDPRIPIFRTAIATTAKYATDDCPRCHDPISPGEHIRQWVGRWVHTSCKVAL